MSLHDLLVEKRDTILKKWFNRILESYPPDTSRFLRTEKDQFNNPVGRTIRRGIEGIYEGLLAGGSNGSLVSSLDGIIRIRSVQDFSSSQAVAFVFQLKRVIREELKGELGGPGLSEELSILESRVDELALLAFDVYTRCREQVHEIRVSEIKKRSRLLLERLGSAPGMPEGDGETQR